MTTVHLDIGFVDLVLRVTAAALAGIAIGFEREVGDHVAGIRTHTLVAVGAAMFAISGAYGFTDIPRAAMVDPSRVAAQVASGIGFIGAGAIVKDGVVVRGLTTAATLWLSAALGMAGGAGAYGPLAVGLTTVMLVLIALRLVKPAARGIAGRAPSLLVAYRQADGMLDHVLRTVEGTGVSVARISVPDGGIQGPGVRTVVLDLKRTNSDRLVPAVEALAEHQDVVRLSLRSGAPARGPRRRRFGDPPWRNRSRGGSGRPPDRDRPEQAGPRSGATTWWRRQP
ncbi:MgtC/SapB family protein [Plantactinospora sp. GCM10030261]|uniref:MgtC/SapB family protein n=1 Tax=Plantactinospora sp. GCM10030261 TaxID=3273420 RepID=UPI003614493C